MPLTSRLPSSTYYDTHARPTAALLRARRQYLVKNIFTGLGLCGFTMAVYAYTIKAISQDDFSDVVPPTVEEAAPAQPASAPNATVNKVSDLDTLDSRRDAAIDRAANQDNSWSNWRPSWLKW